MRDKKQKFPFTFFLFVGQKNALTQETELLESLLQEVEHQVSVQGIESIIDIKVARHSKCGNCESQ